MQIGHRGVFGENQVAPRPEGSAASSCQYQGQVARVVSVAIAHTGTEQNHGLVQDRPGAFLHRAQPIQEIRILLNMPAGDAFVGGQFFRKILVVAVLVVPALHPVEEGEVPAGYGVAEHEGADPGGVGPECQCHDVEHQADLLGMVDAAFAGPGRIGIKIDPLAQAFDFSPRCRIFQILAESPASGPFDPVFDRADTLEVLDHFLLVGFAQLLLQAPSVVGHQIQDAGGVSKARGGHSTGVAK